MVETVRCVLFIALTIAFVGYGDGATDSVPAAITVYRNPEFFGNLTQRRGDSEKEEDLEEEEEEDAYTNNSEEFYDFDDEYRYPGEPKKPNPPSAPDFFTYFDESPEFQPEPRDPPPRRGNQEEEHSEEADDDNELRNPEESERETSDEESNDGESTEHRDHGHTEQQDDEADEEKEATEEDDTESAERDEEPKKDRYYVPMEKDLQLRVPAKVYEESKEYFNPVLNSGITAFHYPSTYEDLDYYSYEDDDRRKTYVDNKKGTREYLKDHSIEETDDPRHAVRAGTKHTFRTVSKFGIKAFKPVLYVPHVKRIKKKYKVLHKPKLHKWRYYREVPDDSVYQLSSDYDSEFEFF